MYFFPPSVAPFATKLPKKKIVNLALSRAGVAKIIVHYEGDFDRTAVDCIQTLLLFLWPFRRCRETYFEAELFLTACLKYLPAVGVLTIDHVNSGYSVPCDLLVVYRRQEWFKVFIHETFHYLNLDRDVEDAVPLPMFNFTFDVNLREAYCEVWARILQCDVLGRDLEEEKAFSVRNMVRVLRQANLRYADLWTAKAATYRENTNVVAYVVIAAILLHNPEKFKRWSPNFRTSHSLLKQLIRTQYRSAGFLKRVSAEELLPSDHGPFRMSVHEL